MAGPFQTFLNRNLSDSGLGAGPSPGLAPDMGGQSSPMMAPQAPSPNLLSPESMQQAVPGLQLAKQIIELILGNATQQAPPKFDAFDTGGLMPPGPQRPNIIMPPNLPNTPIDMPVSGMGMSDMGPSSIPGAGDGGLALADLLGAVSNEPIRQPSRLKNVRGPVLPSPPRTVGL